MIIELNGLAGVGKHTVGRALASIVSGRLIDNHTIYNPAFAATEFRSAAFYETVRAVRDLTFLQAERLPFGKAIVLTIAPGRSPVWAREWQAVIRHLADKRNASLLGVHIYCDPVEGARRIAFPERELLRKLVDASLLNDGHERPVMLDHCDRILELDTTALNPVEAANLIARWAVENSSGG